jgi:transposase
MINQPSTTRRALRWRSLAQAAQGEVVHNDDTSMRVLRLAREPSDERTGVFTSGIVSTGQGWKIAIYFTGAKHAGENLAEVLQQRAQQASPPIQETTVIRMLCPNAILLYEAVS